MKKTILLATFAAMLCGSAACSSIKVVDSAGLNGRALSMNEKTVAHINVSNSGFYFLEIPFICGNPSDPTAVNFFPSDVVNVETSTSMISGKAKELKATEILDLNSSYTRTPLPMTFFLINSRRIQMSGNAVSK